MAATDPLVPPPVDPAAARAAAEDILSRSEFQPRSPSLVSRFFRWLGHLLNVGDGGPSDAGGASPSAGDPGALRLVVWVVLAALVVVAAVALVRWARGAPLPFRRRAPKVTESDEIRSLDEDDAGNPAPSSLAEFEPGEVEALEAAGQWRDALLARYRGAVAQLIGAGVVKGDPGASSAELRAEVDAGQSELSQHFARLTAAFETVWYGGAAADEALAAQARREALAVGAATVSTLRQTPTATTKRTSSTGSDARTGIGADVIIRGDAP